MVSKEQRRRQLAREKFERQQQRRVQARAKKRRNMAIVTSAVVVVVLATTLALTMNVFGGDDKDSADQANASATPSSSPSAPTTPPSKGPDPCKKPAPGSAGKKQYKKEPALTVDTSAKYTATLDTTCGKISLALDPGKAPHTVNSFSFLAKEKYFDHTKCHRLTTQGIFVLQCGDPTGTGSGSPGYQLKDENLKDASIAKGAYPAGTVAMANAGPNTGGSQFFLVYKDSPLPPNYTPFGTVSGGDDVLKKISDAGEQTGQGDGPPNATVVINGFTVTKG